ncbi:MAG: biotin carboxylase N-terminal domain-containing protein [Myxococcota bacterium]
MRTVFIANRGEIAVRVARSVCARGLRAVGVYSDADAGTQHCRSLDEAIRLPGSTSAETYLNVEKVLEAAAHLGADAIHPGYGFLSENAEFAAGCEARGIVFLGPSPEAIRVMGDKGAAKRLMAERDVPLVPGYSGEAQDEATLALEAERIGYPLLLKAAAGGGGRGMRRVANPSELREAVAQARSEAQSAFGRDDLIIEKLVERARHIEVQVVADTHGNVSHLFERECSVQRRHQKVIEEAPSPALTGALRERMGQAAIRAAAAVGYTGVGTVEFLLAEDGAFYFIEMNTRLQVEHPVTEAVTGIDLVDLQLAIGEGLALPDLPREPAGHAIEARLYAEDPAMSFAPQTGVLHAVEWPQGEGVRVDSGVRPGQAVTPHYDPMLAKIIAKGDSREHARRRLVRALEATALLGLKTNLEFLCDVLEDDVFVRGDARTDWLDSRPFESARLPELEAAAVLRFLLGPQQSLPAGEFGRSATVVLNGESRDVRIDRQTVTVDGRTMEVGAIEDESIELDGRRVRFEYARSEDLAFAMRGGRALSIQRVDVGGVGEDASDGCVRAPMSGRVVRLVVAEGDRVERGDLLATLEAMKMEHELVAPVAGRVRSVAVAAGAQAEARQILFEVEETL